MSCLLSLRRGDANRSPHGRSVSLQNVYATLADLAGLGVPTHVDGTSLRPLLESLIKLGRSSLHHRRIR